jgi:peptidoglycan hydrolase-like protein with peptidoglycan-binding domain
MKPTLRLQSRGNAVRELQSKLNLLLPGEQPPLAVDGIFGPKTLQRVRRFQTLRTLNPDGVVGPKTWAALDGSPLPKSSPKPPAPSPPKSSSPPVMDGACLRCPFGTVPSFLKISPPSRPASIFDRNPYVNILPFGMCQSFANPMVVAATDAAQGVLTPQPCMPAIAGMWTPGNPLQPVGPQNAPALTAGSVLPCAWGGVITIG